MILLKKKSYFYFTLNPSFSSIPRGDQGFIYERFFLLLLGSYQGIQLLLTALPTALPHQHRLTILLFLQCRCSDMNVLIGVIICTLCQEPPQPATYRNLKKNCLNIAWISSTATSTELPDIQLLLFVVLMCTFVKGKVLSDDDIWAWHFWVSYSGWVYEARSLQAKERQWVRSEQHNAYLTQTSFGKISREIQTNHVNKYRSQIMPLRIIGLHRPNNLNN